MKMECPKCKGTKFFWKTVGKEFSGGFDFPIRESYPCSICKGSGHVSKSKIRALRTEAIRNLKKRNQGTKESLKIEIKRFREQIQKLQDQIRQPQLKPTEDEIQVEIGWLLNR